MPVRLGDISNSIVDTRLKFVHADQKKTWHNLHLFFFEMSTLKGDERVNIFHFTIHFFRPYVKIGESRLKFVRRNVIF
jgi:hypothetical protein